MAMATAMAPQKLGLAALIVATAVAYFFISHSYDGDKARMLEDLRSLTVRLGSWSIPIYVSVHALLISLCLPYALVLEAGAAYFFGFARGVACVFCAKILSASLSFWIGRTLFRNSKWASDTIQHNKFFRVISDGVAQDGWKFVLLARFSPVPSYVINYALAATNVRYLVDFLLPTIVGCIPMILQNTSIGTLTRVATESAVNGKKSGMLAYVLPLMGVVSSVLIAWRIRKYTSKKVLPGDLQAKSELSNGTISNQHVKPDFTS